ncbi:MAG: zinc dependent phospholipase C family protein [Nitrospirae bacterium]|nr:zinc dependent phospholipase C family protein [Nitrospirota bacterium]
MPATFTHCLIAQGATDLISKQHPYSGKIAMYNQFARIGAAGPDYPYLTDIINGMLGGHNWANRMHYENTSKIIELGADKLLKMNKDDKDFAICLSWLCGYVSHVIVDSFLHPVVNSVVGGIYLFTHENHRHCEIIWDIHIFKDKTGDEIRDSNPRNGFGYLNTLEDCSDPNNPNHLHPVITQFWTELLQKAHPNATDYFDSIDPDKWHENYLKRVNFITDPNPIFRHIWGLKVFEYMYSSEISEKDTDKYIKNVKLPDGRTVTFDTVFDETLRMVADTWIKLFKTIDAATTKSMGEYLKDWNLDTGVNEDKIDLWSKGGTK